MDYKELYAQKLMTAAQAAALVKSGDWVDYGWGRRAGKTPAGVGRSQLSGRHPDVGAGDLPDRRPRCPHDLEQLAHGRH